MKERMIISNFKNTIAMCMVVSICVGLVSCGTLSRSVNAIGGKLKDKPGALKPSQFNIDQGNERGLRGITGKATVSTVGTLTTREEDIIWADEDPEVPIAELEGIVVDDDDPLDAWYEDYGKVMRKSRLEGKPVLMWFMKSNNSPLCKRISAEVFMQKEFEEWAEKNVIRLRIDSFVQRYQNVVRKKVKGREEYVKNLKKRYGVMGQPEVFILSPRGTKVARYRGYKSGTAEFYFGRLRNARRTAQEDYSEWRSKLEDKGYRSWRDNRGRGVFAKLIRYRKGRILLMSPDGKKSRKSVSKLSAEDRQHIERKLEEAKAKAALRKKKKS